MNIVAVVKRDADKPAGMAFPHRGHEGFYADTAKSSLGEPRHLLGEPGGRDAQLVWIFRDLFNTVVHEYERHVTEPKPGQVACGFLLYHSAIPTNSVVSLALRVRAKAPLRSLELTKGLWC
jgi:hypothetical protein